MVVEIADTQVLCCGDLLQVIPLKAETRALWELLFTDFSQFTDFRVYKAERGGTAPDFRHKETGQGLW